MDSVLVIIRLTGLLLFSQPANGPMHVFMPAELPGMDAHVAQIGYYTPNATGCEKWVPDAAGTRGVCFIRLDNSTMEIGTPGNSTPVGLPDGNVSHAPMQHRPVGQNYFASVLQNVPDLKGRIILHEGNMTGCPLGRFEFQHGATVDSVDLVNVVVWTYKLPPNATLTLTRHQLRASGPQDTTWTVSQDLSHVIELYIRHVPDPDNSPPIQHGDEVGHYRAYYRLLPPPGASGPVPHFGRLLGNLCAWPVAPLVNHLMDNAGTMSCMVAAGDPP